VGRPTIGIGFRYGRTPAADVPEAEPATPYSRAVTDPTPAEEAVARPRLLEGARVEVRNGFDGSWTSGFVVMEVTDTGYRLRRRYDHDVLPTEFAPADVRRERKNSMWWV
jgi:hypothetical protein